ncbi:MAG: hypothetical protein M0D57_13680 [Sphingobacteriales bacterium JAD_PAG50586_3]|nr:MAG: hypothetical protein M0D57_13680 [Sphingobacteriales bacterium JAD_PAG50586_3]
MRKKQIKDDPLGSYERKCPFCGEKFIANHKHRKYCPSKNNIPNFCKHQFKDLMEEERLSQIQISASSIITTVNNAGQLELPIQLSESSGNAEVLEENIRVIRNLMQDKKELAIEYDKFFKTGIDLTAFSKRITISGTEYFALIMGDYEIVWFEPKKIVITPQINVLCM